jgi:phage tail sheath protein FI
MAELTFRSPGVSTREIDVSGPSGTQPSGIPAAVIGTSTRGPAFVPVTVANFQDFIATFGNSDGQKYGPMAMREWLRNAGSGVYVKVLGAGDGTQRTVTGGNKGKVTNSGFVVGERLPNNNSGLVDSNQFAVTAGPLGRTHFLGCYMSESAGSNYLSSAGIQVNSNSVPIARGVIMTPSGVFVTLQSGTVGESSLDVQNRTANGKTLGTIDTTVSGRDQFVLMLNGHINNANYPNVITASMDPTAPNYFANILNRDPTKVQEAGHYLYSHHNVYPALAEVTASGLIVSGNLGFVPTAEPAVFVLTSSLGHNQGSSTVPNYENFEDRFRTPVTPWIISQAFGGKPKNLFRFHALDDGAFSTDRLKVSIENISTSRDESSKFGTFDVSVRRFSDSDNDPVVLERFTRLSLDPNSERYIARVIGDRNTFFDFDKRLAGQRIVVEGNYLNNSSLIRVEMDPEVDFGEIDSSALPLGFRGPQHLVTKGLGVFNTGSINLVSGTNLSELVQPPMPLRETVAVGTGLKKRASNSLYWGFQFETKDSNVEPNRSGAVDNSTYSYSKYFPNYHTEYLNPWTDEDGDEFCNNIFTFQNLAVVTGTDGIADATKWLDAFYSRDKQNLTAPYRYFDPSKDITVSNRQFLKFTTLFQGGFDGVNVFDKNKTELNDLAVKREVEDANQGNTNGPTVSSYTKALTILGGQYNADIQLLAIPGIRQPAVTDFAIQEIESRFDALYLLDVEAYDSTNNPVVNIDKSEVSITYTANNFVSRNLDSSFAAAYFPDVVISDPNTRTNVVVPPTVAVLGAFSLNDAIGFPWNAPAGFTRGALQTVQEAAVKLNRANLDVLYDSDINPIVAFPGRPTVVFGQKTLQQAQTALDRVNVRRLLIDIRRKVKSVANSFIFEPNRAETLSRFQSQVQPILQTIQAQRGVEKFKVSIDASTTTQADIENNTIRGKIFLQPTRTLEFVSLDFVVTNSGAVV